MIRFEHAPDFDYRTVAAAVAGGRIDVLAGRGDAAGVYAFDGSERVGAMVLGTIHDGRGTDIVLHALAGRHPALIGAVDGFVRHIARGTGCDGVRAYTERPGLMRAFGRYGWGEIGRIYRVSHG